QTASALPLGEHRGVAPTVASTCTIAYQGRLADAADAPLTGTYSIIFRLYDAATGGTPLWTE
ncbi:MAG: collagen-like protein, partial [Anaerolineae bacterium]